MIPDWMWKNQEAGDASDSNTKGVYDGAAAPGDAEAIEASNAIIKPAPDDGLEAIHADVGLTFNLDSRFLCPSQGRLGK